MLTLLAFLLTLGLLITVHEYGHYRIALACGVGVERFSIGFGPVLFKWQVHHRRTDQATEFVVSLIPLGGYVRMVDENQGVVAPEQLGSAFNRKSVWSRMAIVLAGPVANLILSWLLLSVVGWSGQWQTRALLPSAAPGSLLDEAGAMAGLEVLRIQLPNQSWHQVASLEDLQEQLGNWSVLHEAADQTAALEVKDPVQANTFELMIDLNKINAKEHTPQWWQALGLWGNFSPPVIKDVVAGGVAAQAGLQKGDEVLRINQQKIIDVQHLRRLIQEFSQNRAYSAAQLWEVRHSDGVVSELELTPRIISQDGQLIGRIDAMLGTQPQQVWVQAGLLDGAQLAAGKTIEMIKVSLNSLLQIGLGKASLEQIGGPLSIAEFAGKSASHGFVSFALFLAWISAGLAVLNLLPIPVLDGGLLMYYLWEAVFQKPLSPVWLTRLQRIGAVLLILLMLVAIRNDLMRWLSNS